MHLESWSKQLSIIVIIIIRIIIETSALSDQISIQELERPWDISLSDYQYHLLISISCHKSTLIEHIQLLKMPGYDFQASSSHPPGHHIWSWSFPLTWYMSSVNWIQVAYQHETPQLSSPSAGSTILAGHHAECCSQSIRTCPGCRTMDGCRV